MTWDEYVEACKHQILERRGEGMSRDTVESRLWVICYDQLPRGYQDLLNLLRSGGVDIMRCSIDPIESHMNLADAVRNALITWVTRYELGDFIDDVYEEVEEEPTECSECGYPLKNDICANCSAIGRDADSYFWGDDQRDS